MKLWILVPLVSCNNCMSVHGNMSEPRRNYGREIKCAIEQHTKQE